MATQAPQSTRVHFGVFELDLQTGELRRSGVLLHLAPQPFKLLAHLASHPDELITRQELREQIWGQDTFVDFEHGLNMAINEIRRAIGDEATAPRFIETLPRRGYRFIGPANVVQSRPLEFPVRPMSLEEGEEQHAPVLTLVEKPAVASRGWHVRRGNGPAKTRHRAGWTVLAAGIAVVCAALGITWWRGAQAIPVVESVTQLTQDGQAKPYGMATDGSRIYFNEGMPLYSTVAQVSVNGGPTVPFHTKLLSPAIFGVNREGSALLAWAHTPTLNYSMWWVPLPAGEPHDLGHWPGARFLPDGRLVLGADTKDVVIADENATHARKLTAIPGMLAFLDVSLDGKRVLLGIMPEGGEVWDKGDTFEVETNGAALYPIRKASPDECCFKWSWDGKYLLYSAREGKRWDLWALPVHPEPLRSKKPIRLTNGPLSFPQGAIPSRDGKQIFVFGEKLRGELIRYDMQLRRFVPLLGGISATNATYSRDGDWAAFTTYPDHILWRSRSDGAERMQLTYPPMEAADPFISPDGTKVVFGTPTDGVFMVDMKGGEPQRIGEHLSGPKWSPDGSSIVVTWSRPGKAARVLKVIDVRTGKAVDIPGSRDKVGPCWLDQETLLASDEGSPNLFVFHLQKREWSNFLTTEVVNYITSPDGKYVYTASGNPDPGLQRIRLSDRQMETITSLNDFPRVLNFGWTQLGVTPDGSPVLTRAADGSEVYALNVRWPR